jgi:hypothetical protein
MEGRPVVVVMTHLVLRDEGPVAFVVGAAVLGRRWVAIVHTQTCQPSPHASGAP